MRYITKQTLLNKRSRKDYKVTFTFTNYKFSEGTFSVLKRIKTYIGSSMGNNQLHALILLHIHKNILNNINLVDVANEFVDKKDSS